MCWTAGAVSCESTHPPWDKVSLYSNYTNKYYTSYYHIGGHSLYDSSILTKLKLVIVN